HTRSKRDWSSDVCSSDLKKTIYAFLIIVAILFIIWLVLLQIGSQGDYFRESKIYDQVETDTSHNEETFNIKLNKVEDKTAHYDRSEERRVGKEYRQKN